MMHKRSRLEKEKQYVILKVQKKIIHRTQTIGRNQKEKASDGMDKSIIVPFVETSETSQQSLTSSEISEDIITSREDTPCPVTNQANEHHLILFLLREIHQVQLSSRLNKSQVLHCKNLS
ncbi:hypothetical protein F8M41_011318 [Gigaspora margarita]|uniref:Uncharacterized protein n=1 Tax=Gigaspora margarita TaxID=4874 RepID=A0A8H4A2L0_GIGMA|nr:hypothetical protein F8M41_011318 [Gigaspora margarita]